MENQRSMNDFQIINRLGEGAFGQVFKVKRKQDGEIYALKKIKTMTMKEKDKINALNEIRILASMQGDHIIGYKDSFYDQGSANLCIVLEFASRGDIMKLINDHSKKKKFIQESEIWKAVVHIAKGIRSLHNNNILHRDLKSANIFITENGVYKLGDLNISKVLKQGLAHTQTGTPYYCSPQVWQDKPYGAKSDIWSFGCVLYEMAAQKPPFTASDIQGLYRKICTGVFPRIPNIYSNELSDLINSMLKLNPSLRPSSHDILKSEAVKRNYQGQINEEQAKNANLLQTIQLNHKGWKNLNNNLPKSKYETGGSEELQQSDQIIHNSLLAPNKQSRRLRPLSSKSDHNIQNNNVYERNRSNEKKNQPLEKEPSVRVRGERVMSAYGKRLLLNASDVGTPQKKQAGDLLPSPGGSNSRRNSQSKNNNLALPPINPSRRVRRASDNYQAHLLPPRPQEPKRISNDKIAKNDRPNSRDKLIQAGKQILNPPNYKINVVGGEKKFPPSPSNKRTPFLV